MACTTAGLVGRPYVGAACVGLLVGLAACVDDNHRLTLGHEVELEALSPERPGILSENPPQPGPDDPAIVTGTQPLTLDRSNWKRTVFLVPVDGTGHRPTYAQAVVLKNSTARQRGEFPGAFSALELDDGFTDEQLSETLSTPIVILGTAVAVPFRLFLEPQSIVRYSPSGNYDRWPGGGELTWLRQYQPTGVSPVPLPGSTNPSGRYTGPARNTDDPADNSPTDDPRPSDQPSPEEYPR